MADLGVWLASRGGGGVQESGRTAAPAMEMTQAHEQAMAPHQHPPLFIDFAHGDCGGGRKRQREAEAEAAMSPQFFSLQQPQVISLAQLHKRPATGLRLDFDDGSEHLSSTSTASASCLLSDELAAQRDQHRNEMDRAAEATAARRIREKEAEASEAARRGAEMEERIARLRAEASAWQAKALADQSTASALHAQLQQAAAAAQAQARCKAEEDEAAGAADDAGSCFVDPDRVVEVAAPPPPARPCRACGRRSASVVLLPCRHLCVCAACEPALSAGAAAAAACPMCRGAVTGTVQVFLC
ncbi:hypothetical protein EJB05_23341 [Eragrostis curvula]|uniref:RING-type domain-containing protein n=1 Tax=Eragrostis curvula TaxID=38414 RepID=A0A5J9V6S3_9POAL|nr:hypothetical protein EJB05_23341 [Eragrostis curvula]